MQSSPVRIASFLALALVSIPAMAQSRLSPETGFLNRMVAVSGETYRYQVYVPYGWTDAQRLPVILFLHGGG